MADRLATPEDLASVLQQGVDTATAIVLIEIATGIVQEAAGGQRIVQVVDDSVSILGNSDSWLDLPQIPVTVVTSVTLDGTTLTAGTDYKVFGNRLWRRQGWQTSAGLPWSHIYDGQPWYIGAGQASSAPPLLGLPVNEPSAVAVVCTHGYPGGDQRLQLARSAVLSICAGAYANPSGLKSEGIDDYHVAYSTLTRELEATPYLKAAIRRQYGRRGGLVRIG